MKTRVEEVFRGTWDHATSAEDNFRNLERNVTHALLPLAGRVVGVLPSGFDVPDWQVLAGFTLLSTIGGTVADYVVRDRDPFDAYRWKYFGSGSPIASFFRGAYGSVGLSAIGLGIVLPSISGGVQVDPVIAAEIIAGTSVITGAIRAAGKVIGNREYAETQWLKDAEEAGKP